ncbi:MAG: hypothetical protein AAF465_10000 [Pseudomonadota bacterium]
MEFSSFIEQLANGPFVVFAFVIGLIVSIDVSVVELTREYPKKPDDQMFHRRKLWMALWHSLFHSLSFFIYMLLILAFQSLLNWPIDIWDVPDGVGIAIISILNFLIVCFVWWTYRDKVKEDHSEKANDENAVDRNDMRLFVDVVRAFAQKVGISDGARGISIAGAVAVDMLAISALLKTYLIPNVDTPPVATLSGTLLVDLLIFAAVIFVVVGGVVLTAQTWGQKIRRNLEKFNFIAALRLIEPFAVFLIVSGTLRHMLEFYSGTPSEITGFGAYFFDIVFAVGIVFSLVISTGLTWGELNEIYEKSNDDDDSTNPDISFSQIWADVRRAAPALIWILVSFAFITIAIIYSYSTIEGPDSHNHLVESTALIAGLGLLVSLFFLYAPFKRIDKYETDQSASLVDLETENPRTIWSRFWGVFIALFLFNVLNFAFAGWGTTEVQAISFWSAYLLLTMCLFDMRRWRFCRSGTAISGGGRQNDALFAEVVAAFGLASSIIAMAALLFVTKLIE